MNSADEIAVTEGSGNVFADLEIADPEEALVKAELARAISTIIGGSDTDRSR